MEIQAGMAHMFGGTFGSTFGSTFGGGAARMESIANRTLATENTGVAGISGFQQLPPDLQASINAMIQNYYGTNAATGGMAQGVTNAPMPHCQVMGGPMMPQPPALTPWQPQGYPMMPQPPTRPANFEADLANGDHVSLTPRQVLSIETLRNATPPIRGTKEQLQNLADDPNTDPAIRKALHTVLGNNDTMHFLIGASNLSGGAGHVGHGDYQALNDLPGWNAAAQAAAIYVGKKEQYNADMRGLTPSPTSQPGWETLGTPSPLPYNNASPASYPGWETLGTPMPWPQSGATSLAAGATAAAEAAQQQAMQMMGGV